jgi:hypothetical protein
MQQDERSNFSEKPVSGHRPEMIESQSPMMRELQRWNISTRVKIGAPRWAEWARSIIARHGQIAGPGRAQAMTFVQPATIVDLHERLINLSLNFYSRINLAIQPILREIQMIENRASRAASPRLETRPAYLRGAADMTLAPPLGLLTESGTNLPVTFASSRERSRTNNITAENSSASVESSPGISTVFRRLRGIGLAGLRRSETTDGDSERHAPRILRQGQRVEQPVSGSVAEVARRTPAAAPQQAAPQVTTTEHVAQQTLGMFRAQEQFWRSNAPQVPEAVVEQLTERVIRQIDQRTIAWRERMGKI